MRDNHDELDGLLDSALATYADPGPDSGLEDRIVNRIAAEAARVPRRRWLVWAIAAPVAVGLLIIAGLVGVRHSRMSPSSPQVRSLGQPSAPTQGEIAADGRAKSGIRQKSPTGAKAQHSMGCVNGTTEVVPCYKTLSSSNPSATGSSNVSATGEAANSLRSRLASVKRGEAPLHKVHPRGGESAARAAPLPKLDLFPTPRPLSAEEEALVNFAAKAPKTERESLLAAQEQADAPLSIAAIEIKPLEPPASGAN
ncbi:MAG TPA: hypothetical protein VGR47_21240 [Terracidiphilus sp.]|nr:hypothetical protein [Terracidiphilus sp.]